MKNSNVNFPNLTIVFTDHARQRGQSRGIKLLSAELAARFGKKRRARGGRFQRVFTRSCVSLARTAGVAAHDIEVAINVPVVVDEHVQGTRTVVSILPKTRRRRAIVFPLKYSEPVARKLGEAGDYS